MGIWDALIIFGTTVSFSALVGGFGYLLKTVLTEWPRRLVAQRAPAPELNPKWDVTVCKHPDLIPVIPSGEEEVVAYLCTNPACLGQVELDDPAVKVNHKWNSTKAQMERHQDRVTMIRGGQQTREQAQDFAARTRAAEFARGGPVPTGSYTMQSLASEVFIPVVPDLRGLQVPAEMIWDRIPGWTESDTERAQDAVKKSKVLDDLLTHLEGLNEGAGS